MRRNKKLHLKSEEEIEQTIVDNRNKATTRYYKRNGIKYVDNRTTCQKRRHVFTCEECCRFAYCNGLAKNPYPAKEIDLFLNTKLER